MSAILCTDPNLYPDTSAHEVRCRLAALHGLDGTHFFVGPGSDAVLMTIAAAFLEPNDHVVIPTPSYSGFQDAVANSRGIVVPWRLSGGFQYQVNTLTDCLTSRPKMVIVCNPNNPTASTLTATQLQQVYHLASETGTLLVVDEAYAEYGEDSTFDSALSLLKQGAGVFVLRTFSKFYGLAGLRIGYVAGPPDLIHRLEQVARPFRVNAVAQRAAVVVLDATEFHRQTKELADSCRVLLVAALKEAGFSVVSGPTNFVLVEVDDGYRCAQVLREKGIEVMPLPQPGLERYVRITLGMPEDVPNVVAALVHTHTEKLGVR